MSEIQGVGVCDEDWVGLVIEKQAIKIKRLMKTLFLHPGHKPHIRFIRGMWKRMECYELSPEIRVEPSACPSMHQGSALRFGQNQLQCLLCILGGGNVQHRLQSPALGHGCSETCSLHSVSCFALETSPVPSPQTLHLSLFIWVAAFPSDLVFLCPSLEVFLHFLLLTTQKSVNQFLSYDAQIIPTSRPRH